MIIMALHVDDFYVIGARLEFTWNVHRVYCDRRQSGIVELIHVWARASSMKVLY
jgi:hypothetical protein